MRTFFISLLMFFGTIPAVYAVQNIQFPIEELGNCSDESSCYAYCEEEDHHDACMSFAQANDLVDEVDIEKYESAQEALKEQGGPGGCTDQSSCEAFCSDITHIDECLAFAESNNLMSEEELVEAKQIKAVLDDGGTLPGECTDKASCEAYCEDPANLDECLLFAKSAGLMTEDEIEQAEQAIELMQSGEMPGGCLTKDACEAYCEDEAHFEECIAFAVKAGYVTQEQVDAMMQEMQKEDFAEQEPPEMNEPTEYPDDEGLEVNMEDQEKTWIAPDQMEEFQIEEFEMNNEAYEQLEQIPEYMREDIEQEIQAQIEQEMNQQEEQALEQMNLNQADREEEFSEEQPSDTEELPWDPSQTDAWSDEWKVVPYEEPAGDPSNTDAWDEKWNVEGAPSEIESETDGFENAPATESFEPSESPQSSESSGEEAQGVLQSHMLQMFHRATRNIRILLAI